MNFYFINILHLLLMINLQLQLTQLFKMKRSFPEMFQQNQQSPQKERTYQQKSDSENQQQNFEQREYSEYSKHDSNSDQSDAIQESIDVKNKDRVNYEFGAEEYLRKITEVIDRRFGSEKQEERKQSKVEDDQIKSIIEQVLNKRKKISRFSNFSASIHQNSNINGIDQFQRLKKPNLSQIQRINARLSKQNDELVKNIKMLNQKLRRLNEQKTKKQEESRSSIKSSIFVGNHSIVMQQKQKQLEKLKKRLQKAEKANSRMQLQLTSIQQSRKKCKSKEVTKSASVSQYKIKVTNCENCEQKRQDLKQHGKVGENLVSNLSSPARRDFYSPIMEFQQYSLKNEPNVSAYENSLQKTSQFGFNLIGTEQNEEKKQYSTKSIQVEIGLREAEEQKQSLDDKIAQLEIAVRKNNEKISKYESILFKKS